MVKWVGVGFHRVVSARSWKGHLKITARSNERKTRENCLFFSTLMFSLDVYDCLKHTYTPTQNIPKHLNRSEDNNKRGWKGYTLSNHPCVTPVWYRRGGGPRVVVSTAAFHVRVWGSVPGLGGLKDTKMFLPHPRVKLSIVGSLCDREVACSASDRQGSNFESCVWRTVSSHSSHHPQEVLLAQFSLYVHKGSIKPDSFHSFLISQK